MKIPFRPLGKVRELVQATGLDIAYAFEDLVFSDHSVFIIRFDDKLPEILYLHFNCECDSKKAVELESVLQKEAKLACITLFRQGSFEIRQIEDKEELEISFL